MTSVHKKKALVSDHPGADTSDYKSLKKCAQLLEHGGHIARSVNTQKGEESVGKERWRRDS